MDFKSAGEFVRDQDDIERRKSKLARRLGAYIAPKPENDTRTPEERFQDLGEKVADLASTNGAALTKFVTYTPETALGHSGPRVLLRADYLPSTSAPHRRGRTYKMNALWRSDIGVISREELFLESPDACVNAAQLKQLDLLAQTVTALEARLRVDPTE